MAYKNMCVWKEEEETTKQVWQMLNIDETFQRAIGSSWYHSWNFSKLKLFQNKTNSLRISSLRNWMSAWWSTNYCWNQMWYCSLAMRLMRDKWKSAGVFPLPFFLPSQLNERSTGEEGGQHSKDGEQTERASLASWGHHKAASPALGLLSFELLVIKPTPT